MLLFSRRTKATLAALEWDLRRQLEEVEQRAAKAGAGLAHARREIGDLQVENAILRSIIEGEVDLDV